MALKEICPKCKTEMIEVFELSYPKPTLTKYVCSTCGYKRSVY